MSTVVEQAEATEPIPPARGVKPRVYRNPNATLSWEEWIKLADAFRQNLFEKYGIMEDSTLLIAEDRRRDD
jgi:hypothetical protein